MASRLGRGFLVSRTPSRGDTFLTERLSVIEGLATVIAGAASFWIIQDFPDTAKFLSEAERTVVVRRLQGDDQFSAAGETLKMKYIWKSILDWKTWLGSKFYFNLCRLPFF